MGWQHIEPSVPTSDLSPGEIARQRTETLAGGTATVEEQTQFLAEFGQVFTAARQGADLYLHWRRIQGNDAWVAGYIEGVAAARRADISPLAVKL